MSIHFGKIAALTSRKERLAAAVGLFPAAAIAAYAIAGSFLNPTKPLGLAVAIVVCFDGGWFFASFLARLKGDATPSLQGELEREHREMMAAARTLMPEGFVRLLLTPAKTKAVFVETPLTKFVNKDGWLSQKDFATAFNNRLLGA